MADSAPRSMEADVTQVLDDLVEKLRWCREHLSDRTASQTLRELEARLGYLAQALSWDIDGETASARQALNLALGRPLRQQAAYFDPHDPHGFGLDWWMQGH